MWASGCPVVLASQMAEALPVLVKLDCLWVLGFGIHIKYGVYGWGGGLMVDGKRSGVAE